MHAHLNLNSNLGFLLSVTSLFSVTNKNGTSRNYLTRRPALNFNKYQSTIFNSPVLRPFSRPKPKCKIEGTSVLQKQRRRLQDRSWKRPLARKEPRRALESKSSRKTKDLINWNFGYFSHLWIHVDVKFHLKRIILEKHRSCYRIVHAW